MLISTKLLTKNDLKSPIAEAYKTLRTNIQFSSVEGGLKTLLITSSSASEGKSITSANIAITMAQMDLRVLLIDCDLRKPELHRVFSMINGRGLTNILVEGVKYNDLINRTSVENLDIITSGFKSPNPSEILGSCRMQTLMDQLKESYDMIILDSPPVLPVTDAAVLSRVTDGVILVAEYAITTYEILAKAKTTLEKVNARILGVVLNRVPQNHREYYYYYHNEDTAKNMKNGKRTSIPKQSFDV
jgi:capsular exopolysaccharide synthesis family protein